jgi:hypothetical protein
MDEDDAMSDTQAEMREIIAELPKAMCQGRVRNTSAFVSTGVMYPNGVVVVVRIDEDRQNFIVSDDGYAAQIAETMGVVLALRRMAPGFASRSGVSFERAAFLLSDVSRDNLHVAVAAVANTSARAMERVIASLGQPKLKRSRALFDKRLRSAFGDKIKFDLEFRGATGRSWDFDAGVEEEGWIVRLFELVSPTTQAVAMANMKIFDTQALPSPPIVTVALVNYERTDPTLRSILSAAGGLVIAANDDVSKYQLSAA